MTFPRFELRDMLTCSATDDEGFRCVRRPSHDGPHEWGRCAHVDARGHRCIMPPGHPDGHHLAWFDRPTEPGARHTVRYEGTEASATTRAAADSRVFGAHDWVPVSRSFRAGLPWRWSRFTAAVASLSDPRGALSVVFEYRPSSSRGAADPG
jgi:hypothetical protein